ncbi:MAG: DUF3987 domain-containing protein [Mycobacteriales bacterium]
MTQAGEPRSEACRAVLAAPAGWPDPPTGEAFHGVAGAIATTIAPHTEADPVAILAQTLVGAGALIGRGAYVTVEATRHHPSEFAVLVGESAKARKGSSWDHVERILSAADPAFAELVHTGLSTGEGLIWAARGAHQRLLVVEPEFVSVLKATSRDAATLSPVLRAGWDGRPLAILTRTAPVHAAAAHLALIGHITRAELARHLDGMEAVNGFLNRFLFFACRRQRLLPEGGHPDPLAGTGLTERLTHHLALARHAGALRFDPPARREWADIYAHLAAEPADGLIGALSARAEAHVLRLSMLYALTDGQHGIGASHLRSALALFDYTTRSLAWATATATGDPVREQITAALATNTDGLTRTQLRDLFTRNTPAARIDAALAALAGAGQAHRHRIATAGRPAEVWTAHRP